MNSHQALTVFFVLITFSVAIIGLGWVYISLYDCITKRKQIMREIQQLIKDTDNVS